LVSACPAYFLEIKADEASAYFGDFVSLSPLSATRQRSDMFVIQNGTFVQNGQLLPLGQTYATA
jgi:hypothetical protein